MQSWLISRWQPYHYHTSLNRNGIAGIFFLWLTTIAVESLPVSILFAIDHTFVPNVFTPNGDENNPVFKVQTESEISMFRIFNRYGKEIYSNPKGEWDGDSAPAGVYL